jgi:hypothetical protein
VFESRKEKDFSFLYRVQTGYEARPASYATGIGIDFPEIKATGV